MLTIKSKIYQDLNKYEEALKAEEECVYIYKKLFRDADDRTLSSYYRAGILHLKLQNPDYLLHPKLKITQLKVFLPLIQAYIDFNELTRLQQVITQIKEESCDLVFLAFVSAYFSLPEKQVIVLSEQEELSVLDKLMLQKKRNYLEECIKYDILLFGAMEYCDEKIKKLDYNIWKRNIKTMLNIKNNANKYDKLKKRDLLI